MRTLLLGIFLFVSSVLSAQNVIGRFNFPTPAVLADTVPVWTNLISWWNLDETGGGIAYDSHGTDDGTVYNATQTASGVVFNSDDDSISITGYLFNTEGTWIIIATPNGDDQCDIIGGDEGAAKLVFWTDYRMRVLSAGSGGTTVYGTSATNATKQMYSVVLDSNNDTVRFGINGANFETETSWDELPTENTTRIGGSEYDFNEFVGTIHRVVWFSDLKTDSYITAFYNGGSYTDYEDGDPE